MTEIAAVLIVLFNSSSWSNHSKVETNYPTMRGCMETLTEMKIANDRPNSGVVVVAYCAPK